MLEKEYRTDGTGLHGCLLEVAIIISTPAILQRCAELRAGSKTKQFIPGQCSILAKASILVCLSYLGFAEAADMPARNCGYTETDGHFWEAVTWPRDVCPDLPNMRSRDLQEVNMQWMPGVWGIAQGPQGPGEQDSGEGGERGRERCGTPAKSHRGE